MESAHVCDRIDLPVTHLADLMITSKGGTKQQVNISNLVHTRMTHTLFEILAENIMKLFMTKELSFNNWPINDRF